MREAIFVFIFIMTTLSLLFGCGEGGGGSFISSQVDTQSVTQAKSIAAGTLHTCALTSTGGVKCWGYNGDGQLGNGATTNSLKSVEVSELSNAIAVAAGNDHTCAITNTGSVKCWGLNHSGQLGNGSNTVPEKCGITECSTKPVDVTGLSGVIAIAVGGDHTCALTAKGEVKCWGRNSEGQLGNASRTDSSFPVDTGLNDVTSIAAGGWHTCAITRTDVKCWGYNAHGQLGVGTNKGPEINGELSFSSKPVSVFGDLSDVMGIDSGSEHTCVLTSAGGVKCWGLNRTGQLGIGTIIDTEMCTDEYGTFSCFTKPTDVTLLTGAISIITGDFHTCAVINSGVKCWGSNSYGQLGNGTTINLETCENVSCSSKPIDVIGLSNVVAMAAGWLHTCAVSSTGGVKCWGINNAGQLGVGTSTGPETCGDSSCSTKPVDVIGFGSG